MFDADALLAEFFRADVDAERLPGLSRLLSARDTLHALITLFRGGDDEVLVRLLVLRDIGARAAAPRWQPAELSAHFAYLNPVKLDTVLKRLREHGLLVWDGDDGSYALSQPARLVLAALSTLLGQSGDEAELGYLTSQVAAGEAVGDVSADSLQHLLARLNELHAEFLDALESQSEFRITAAQDRLQAVWRWVEKSTDIIRRITADDSLPLAVLNQAQAIALAQSRMLHLAGAFQRRLAQLAAQRVHLGQSGLTSTDIAAYLRRCSQAELARLAGGLLPALPQLTCLTPAEMADTAEFELCGRLRPTLDDDSLPPPAGAPEADADAVERLWMAEALYARLAEVREPTLLSDAVLADSWPETAYRLSLLALLGDPESRGEASVIAELARLPLQLDISPEMTALDHPTVAGLSRGLLLPKPERE